MTISSRQSSVRAMVNYTNSVQQLIGRHDDQLDYFGTSYIRIDYTQWERLIEDIILLVGVMLKNYFATSFHLYIQLSIRIILAIIQVHYTNGPWSYPFKWFYITLFRTIWIDAESALIITKSQQRLETMTS